MVQSIPPTSMKSPLFKALASRVRMSADYRYVFNPSTEWCYFNDAIRRAVGLKRSYMRISEAGDWILNQAEAHHDAVDQLVHKDHYNQLTVIKLKDGTIQKWLTHGKLVQCKKNIFPICAKPCSNPRCLIVLGVSVPLTEPYSPRSTRLPYLIPPKS